LTENTASDWAAMPLSRAATSAASTRAKRYRWRGPAEMGGARELAGSNAIQSSWSLFT
jgi:hypothetical protein